MLKNIEDFDTTIREDALFLQKRGINLLVEVAPSLGSMGESALAGKGLFSHSLSQEWEITVLRAESELWGADISARRGSKSSVGIISSSVSLDRVRLLEAWLR